jgi:hypothetical protein
MPPSIPPNPGACVYNTFPSSALAGPQQSFYRYVEGLAPLHRRLDRASRRVDAGDNRRRDVVSLLEVGQQHATLFPESTTSRISRSMGSMAGGAFRGERDAGLGLVATPSAVSADHVVRTAWLGVTILVASKTTGWHHSGLEFPRKRDLSPGHV